MNPDLRLGNYLVLSALQGVGPARLKWLLTGGSASEVVGHLRAGRLPPQMGQAPAGVSAQLVRSWCSEVRNLDGPKMVADAREAGIEIIDPGHELWPFVDDPEPPIMAFARGDLGLLDRRPTVAVVGTRRCTSVGREMAYRLGQGLAEAGLVVISGLATGIDGAVHEGALASGGQALAVVGSGLDVVYPKANRRLWNRIGSEGLLLSEAVPGAKPERWRFPARNRLIAALADLVVVVESHAEGGSLLTVAEAADRGVEVVAVPGSVLSPASVGSNQLLVDGCAPVCSVDDVLDMLDPVGVERSRLNQEPEHGSEEMAIGHDVSPLGVMILSELTAGACHLDRLLSTCRATIPQLLTEVNHLESLGLLILHGSTVERPRPLAASAQPPAADPSR